MILERPSSARGHVHAGRLDSRHAFSFGSYYDPAWMGFGPLRVVNEARVDPGAGFAPQRRANMEILSYVVAGELAHRDSAGGDGVVHAGELQWTSAGHGVEHGERNASDAEPLHLLQIWLQPSRLNHRPAQARRAAAAADARGWTLLASPDGRDGSLPIRVDADLHQLRLASGEDAALALDPARLYWLQVVRGAVDADGRRLQAGDALGFSDESGALRLIGAGDGRAEVLLLDLAP